MLVSLSEDGKYAICMSLHIMLENCVENPDPYDLDIYNPEYYSSNDILDERHFFSDWCLSIYHGNMGTIYDFNGWPGDNGDSIGLLKLPWNFEKKIKDNYECDYMDLLIQKKMKNY